MCLFADELSICKLHIDHSTQIFQKWTPESEWVERANGHISRLSILKILSYNALARSNDKKTDTINDDSKLSLVTWKLSQVIREVLSQGKIPIKSHKSNIFEKKQRKGFLSPQNK